MKYDSDTGAGCKMLKLQQRMVIVVNIGDVSINYGKGKVAAGAGQCMPNL